MKPHESMVAKNNCYLQYINRNHLNSINIGDFSQSTNVFSSL